MKKAIIGVLLILAMGTISGCIAENDVSRTVEIGKAMSENQATPTDISFSLERHNLIRRAYWVNGQREKAMSLVSEIDKPLGYIILITENGGILGRFIVDGKVTSLNSYLTPESEVYGREGTNRWIPDVDGSYGENDNGIFFFTPDGKYIEWTGTYLYSDIPFEVENPILRIKGE